MTEETKRKLNSSLITFVNRELDRQLAAGRACDPHQILKKYLHAESELIRESGATLRQVARMVDYTLEMGYPQDPFLACEFDNELFEEMSRPETMDDARREFCLENLDRIGRSLDLTSAERQDLCDRHQRIFGLLRPFCEGVVPELTAGEAMSLLADKYDQAIARNLPREPWMEQLESLIVPARVVDSGISTLDALRKIVPKVLHTGHEPLEKQLL